MPLEQGRIVIAPGVLDPYKGKVISKTPMTSKQVKKAYKERNKAPKITKAQQRAEEKERRERERLEVEREKRLERDQRKREQAKQKAEEEKKERKRAGIPEKSRWVRASQPRISGFAGLGKRSREVSTENEGNTTGMDDTTVAEEHRDKRANRESGYEDSGYNSHPTALNGDTTMPDNTTRPSQIQIVVPSLPKGLQQAYSSHVDADLSPDETAMGEIEDTTIAQPVTKSPSCVFTHEEVEETRHNFQSSQLEEAVTFETLIADETDLSIVVRTPPKAVPWVAPSPLRQSSSRLDGMEDSTMDCALPTNLPKCIDEQAVAKDGFDKSFCQLSPKRAPCQPKSVTKTPVLHQNPQFAASQDYFAMMDDDDDDFNFDIPDFSTPKPPTAAGKPAPVNTLPKPPHKRAVSSPSPRRPTPQAAKRVVNKMMPPPRSTRTTPVQPPRPAPMQFAASPDYFAEMDLDDEDFITTRPLSPKRPLPQAPKSSVTKMMPPPPKRTLPPQPPRSAPIQFEASHDYFAEMDLDDDDFAAVDLSHLAKPATLLSKPYSLLRQQSQLRNPTTPVPKQQAPRAGPDSILKASSNSIKPPCLKSGYYKMDKEFLYTETEEPDATYKCRVMRNGTMRPPHINWLHVKTPLEAVDMDKLMLSGAKMIHLPNESRTTTPKSASKPSPKQTPVFKRPPSPPMRLQPTHDTPSRNESQYHSPGIHFENGMSYRSVAAAPGPSEGLTVVAHAVRNMDLSTAKKSMLGPLLYLQDMAKKSTAPAPRKPRKVPTKPAMKSPPKIQQQQTKAQAPTPLPQPVPQVFDAYDFDIPSGTQIERELAEEYGPPKTTPLQPISANTPMFVGPWIYPADLETTTTRSENSGKKSTVSGRTRKEIAKFGETGTIRNLSQHLPFILNGSTVPSERVLQPATQNVLRVQPPEFQQNTSNTKSKHNMKPALKPAQKPPPVPTSQCNNLPQRQPVVKQEPSLPPPEVDYFDLGSFELPTSSQLEREMAEEDALVKSRATTPSPHPTPIIRGQSMSPAHETRIAKRPSQSPKVPSNPQLGAQAKQSQVMNNLSTVIELGDSFEAEGASQLEREIAEDEQVRLRKPASLQPGDKLPPPPAKTSTATVIATSADSFGIVSGSQIEREMAEEEAAEKAAEAAEDTVPPSAQPLKPIIPNIQRQQRPNASGKQVSSKYSPPISIDTGFQEKQLSEEERRALLEKAAIAAREARRSKNSTQRSSCTPWVTRQSCMVTPAPRRQSSMAKVVKEAEQQQRISAPTKPAGPPPQKRRFFIEKPADIAESAEYESRILAEQNAAKIVKAQAEQDAFLKQLIGSQAAKDALAEEQVRERWVEGERTREQGEGKEGHGKVHDLPVLPKESAAQQPKRPITFDNDDEFDFGSDDIDWAGVVI